VKNRETKAVVVLSHYKVDDRRRFFFRHVAIGDERICN